MIDLARLRPARVINGVRRRLLGLRHGQLTQRAEQPDDVGGSIVRLTLSQFVGRVALPKLSITYSDRLIYRRDAVYHREVHGYVLELPTAEKHSATLGKAWELGAAYLFWMLHCPSEVERVAVTLSDGDAASAGRFSPSTDRSDIVPVPDPHFFGSSAFDHFRRLTARDNAPWSERTDDIVWRGTSSGLGSFDPVLGAQHPSRVAQRLELILAAQKSPGVDAALASYRRDEFRPELLFETGVLKHPVAEATWMRRKFAIDVDGQTNTWSNLMIRMLMGCCVLKLESKYGFRQWYYDRLRPWEHYVPVKADATDLGEQVEWVRANDAKAAEIAANGRRLAQSLSFEAGRREAVELITKHWRD